MNTRRADSDSTGDAISFSFYHYDPSMAGAVIFIILFAGTTIFHIYQMVRTRTWFFIPFVIGGICQWHFFRLTYRWQWARNSNLSSWGTRLHWSRHVQSGIAELDPGTISHPNLVPAPRSSPARRFYIYVPRTNNISSTGGVTRHHEKEMVNQSVRDGWRPLIPLAGLWWVLYWLKSSMTSANYLLNSRWWYSKRRQSRQHETRRKNHRHRPFRPNLLLWLFYRHGRLIRHEIKEVSHSTMLLCWDSLEETYERVICVEHADHVPVCIPVSWVSAGEQWVFAASWNLPICFWCGADIYHHGDLQYLSSEWNWKAVG